MEMPQQLNVFFELLRPLRTETCLQLFSIRSAALQSRHTPILLVLDAPTQQCSPRGKKVLEMRFSVFVTMQIWPAIP